MKKINAWSNDVDYQSQRRAQNYMSNNMAKKKSNKSSNWKEDKALTPCTGSCGCGSSCGD